MTMDAIMQKLDSPQMSEVFSRMYGSSSGQDLEAQRARYLELIRAYRDFFGADEKSEIFLFSSPGRTEIGGNHTDHNCGMVLAGSITLDCIGVISPSRDNRVVIHDVSYQEDFTVDLANLDRRPDEKGSPALVRGIAAGFKKFGLNVGGFRACFESRVIPSAGVSSSASFEMMLCAVLQRLYNSSAGDVILHARVGQFAENNYWDKASGLLDQIACAAGGVVSIDFSDVEKPIVEPVRFDFSSCGYDFLIVNTGKGHADLSAEYSSIPAEMKSVAKFFGKNVCAEISEADVLAAVPALRKECGDRAVLRSLHFFEENERVKKEIAALKSGDFTAFLDLVTRSGQSSWEWLQNVYVPSQSNEQPVALALALSKLFIKTRLNGSGACRIHGGGFAGVIMMLLPHEFTKQYIEYIEPTTGVGSVYAMTVRPYGAVCLNDMS